MDVNDLRILVMLAGLVLFIGIWAWAWSKKRQAAFEDAALTTTARVVAAAAEAGTETRGCHHRSDFPDTDPAQAVSRTVHAEPAVACLP